MQGGHPDMNLRDLGFKLTGGQAITEQLFEAVPGIFRDAPAMITPGLFPGRQPLLGNGGQRLGARMSRRPLHRVLSERRHQDKLMGEG
jgi:hypothetical protein